MLTGFEDVTYKLSDYEKKLVQPMVRGLQTKIGEKNAITNKEMVKKMKEAGYKISAPRIRKLIHHIRKEKLVLNLIATSKGYYISTDPKEIENYKKSLKQRIESIQVTLDSFE